MNLQGEAMVWAVNSGFYSGGKQVCGLPISLFAANALSIFETSEKFKC